MAEIYKRIRMEKSNTGRVLSVMQAKQIITEEKNPHIAVKT